MLVLSSLLETKYPYLFKELVAILGSHNISFHLLEKTQDVWCRDYLPVKVNEETLLQFRYRPDYLADYPELKTDPEQLSLPSTHKIQHSDIVLDGGNIVKNERIAIITEKVFVDNPNYSKYSLGRRLCELLKVEQIIFLPAEPGDTFGHSDGMVRFVDMQTVLLASFTLHHKSWKDAVRKKLEVQNLQVHELPTFASYRKNKWGDYTALGCYVNFLELDELLIYPTFGHSLDSVVGHQLQKMYHRKKVIPLDCKDIAIDGGALNCICGEV